MLGFDSYTFKCMLENSYLRMNRRKHSCFNNSTLRFSSVQLSRSVVSDSLQPHESQHARPPCPSPTPGVHSDSCPSSQWCHPAISSSVIPFSSCPQSLPASKSFPISQLFAWGGQSTGVSALASVLPKNTQGWSPSEWTGWISLHSKGLSRVFSNTTVLPLLYTNIYQYIHHYIPLLYTNLKGNQSWIFTGRAESEAPILWPPDAMSPLIEKTLMLGKIEGRRRR